MKKNLVSFHLLFQRQFIRILELMDSSKSLTRAPSSLRRSNKVDLKLQANLVLF